MWRQCRPEGHNDGRRLQISHKCDAEYLSYLYVYPGFFQVDRFHRLQYSIVGALWPVPGFRCPFWAVRAVERYTGPFNKTLANRILVIGNAVGRSAMISAMY